MLGPEEGHQKGQVSQPAAATEPCRALGGASTLPYNGRAEAAAPPWARWGRGGSGKVGALTDANQILEE